MRYLFCLFALPLWAQQGVNTYSPEKERAIGATFAGEVRRQGAPFENEDVLAYVRRVVERLVGGMPVGSPVIRMEMIQLESGSEPVPFPGGFLLVPAKCLLAVQNDTELAGVLAHSMGHIALRHGSRTAMRMETAKFATIPLVFLGGWPGLHSDAQQTGALVPNGLLDAQRGQELEADQLGVDLMRRAGFDPASYREYVRRTQPASASRGTPWLPSKEVRMAALDRLVGQVDGATQTASEDFARVQQAVRREVKPVSRAVPTLRR